MNPDPHIALLVETARLYYIHQMSQQQIAGKIGISRPGVSRLLQQARDEGIVKIEIVDPASRGSHIEQALKEKFKLKNAIVVPADPHSVQETKKRLGQAAAVYLNGLVFDGCTMAVSWGTTMREVVNHLTPRPVKNMTVVQAVGGITHAEFDPHASEIAQRFGENFRAKSFFLLLPAIVDSRTVKEAMVSDKRIYETLNMLKRADIVVCSAGTFKPDSLLIQADYLSPAEVDILGRAGAVGDICCRMITEQGEICWPELDARTVAAEFSDLKKAPYSIAVAGGREKETVIRAGLAGGYFNVLITDDQIAECLLQ
ncbi:sugar-binding transcriptional regulator [bacterium]|nr:sugar-binding transcriptional regulator [bacterium]